MPVLKENELLRFEDVVLARGTVPVNTAGFSLARGENLVIFGQEQSGTGLVCPLIAGAEEEFEGEIFYEGISIESFDYLERHSYRKKLGYLQMDYGLINNMSVEENISLPLKYHSRLSSREIRELIDGFIERLHLGHCRNLRPVDLSRAETLKTAFARAIALDPELLLIEHALEGQCLIDVQVFMRNLKEWALRSDKSVLIVTYEPERFVEYSDCFIMLYEGKIVFSGSREDFLAEKNDYLRQYRASSEEGPMVII